MKIQRLTSFDINILARELGELLRGHTLRELLLSPPDVLIDCHKIILRFCVLSGAPFLVGERGRMSGRPWLRVINGGRIEGVSQVEFDRVLRFEISNRTQLGHKKIYNLNLEFFKNGNIILTDDRQKIISALNRSARRGEPYELARLSGVDIRELGDGLSLNNDHLEKIKKLGIIYFSKSLDQGPEAVARLLKVISESPAPHLILSDANAVAGFSIYGGPFLDGHWGQPRDTLLMALTDYVNYLRQAITAPLPDWKKRMAKAEKKLMATAEQVKTAESYHLMRRYGQILISNLHLIEKSQSEITLSDPYGEPDQMVRISLNPALSPDRNAAFYFDKARKLQASLPRLKDKYKAQQEELVELQNAPVDRTAPGRDRIEAARKLKSAQPKLPFRQFQLEHGWEVFAGKSAASNDELTFSFARKDDLWFHAWQAAGSHVVLRAPQKNAIPAKKTLQQAATLAAYYSKAKTSGKVPVIYTRVKYVRKVRGAAGKVTCTNEKELMVKPLKPELVIESR